MRKVTVIPPWKKRSGINRVGIYARVSTARAEQLRSLSAQVSLLTQYVYSRNDCVIRDIYLDVGSAKTGTTRREFTRLLHDCKEKKLDLIIAKSLSRFGRDNVEVISSMRQIIDANVDIYFVENEFLANRNYLEHELELSIRSAINQSENEHRSENIKMGIRFGLERGTSGLYRKACYGYYKEEDGNLTIDEDQAAVVSHIFDLYMAGNSLTAISETLAEEKIPSPRGSDRWSKKAIETVLTNVKYTGNVAALKSDPWKPGYMMLDAHEPIISVDQFLAVQAEMIRRAKRKRKEERRDIAYLQQLLKEKENRSE